MQDVIVLDQVRKQYKTKVAVDGISFTVGKGEIFGIVGPNGAGKTTLIEMLEGLRWADSGGITILGQDIRKQTEAIKQRIGVLLQSSSIPPKAKVKEVFKLFPSFYNKQADLKEVMQFLGLEDKGNEFYKSLSGGWKQRVSLALALINDPDIIFLDEPSMGLDPNARSEMWAMIHRLRDEGRTILVTTHYMEEAEALCDRVAIINNGQLIALDTPKKLITLLGGTKRIGFKATAGAKRETLTALAHVVQVDWEQDWIKMHSSSTDETLQQLFRLADGEGWMVSGLKLEDASMNDVFSKMTLQGGGKTE
ncbi:Linearmycin resistance ATP-binding protein LnrL [Paenibacillus plantiphilus]|uniref:Linearmycin resistance ATP-binding protein LnrL n=1 Tax=Paenibacillus plantiphilus TaxID=2905650 RepID=A0ABM9CFQ8_9BACL|nr:ABC transporter ATP-binding protein [Paenibacillus plantiphilus]CAH1212567.1 Linearmycin resistance ATP-binding protein LnrL [Paenibacillus plantiphilus]